MSELETVALGEDQVTLADLAGVDLEGVQEKRMFQFPVGHYRWQVIADTEHDAPKLMKLGEKAGAVFNLKCQNVIDVKDPKDCPNGNPMELIGKFHRETLFITSAESLGYLKAFIVDIGGQGKGALGDLLAKTVGLEFDAPIVSKKNPNDSDAPPFINLNRMKIQPALKKAA